MTLVEAGELSQMELRKLATLQALEIVHSTDELFTTIDTRQRAEDDRAVEWLKAQYGE